MQKSEHLAAAMALLDQQPLPGDAFEQLARLEAAAGPTEQEQFGDLWEAFYAAGGSDPAETE